MPPDLAIFISSSLRSLSELPTMPVGSDVFEEFYFFPHVRPSLDLSSTLQHDSVEA
jgi:hypothetical protein